MLLSHLTFSILAQKNISERERERTKEEFQFLSLSLPDFFPFLSLFKIFSSPSVTFSLTVRRNEKLKIKKVTNESNLFKNRKLIRFPFLQIIFFHLYFFFLSSSNLYFLFLPFAPSLTVRVGFESRLFANKYSVQRRQDRWF